MRNAAEARLTLAHTFALPEARPPRLLVRARLTRLSTPAPVLDPSRRTRVFLRFADGAGETLGYVTLLQFGGLAPASAFEQVAAVPTASEQVELFLAANTVGAWRLERLSVEAVRGAPRYRYALGALGIAWTALLLVSLGTMARRGRWRSGALLAVALTVLLLSVALVQPLVRAAAAPVMSALTALLPATSLPTSTALLKIAHAVGFSVLVVTLLVMRRATGLGVRGAIALASLLAVGTEALQRHHPGRSADLADIGIDLLGIGVGALAWGACFAAVIWRSAVSRA